MYQHETGIRITDVDREKHTVRLIVNGSYVEAVFTPNANPDVFDNVKQMTDAIKAKNRDSEVGLCRNVAGFSWPWNRS